MGFALESCGHLQLYRDLDLRRLGGNSRMVAVEPTISLDDGVAPGLRRLEHASVLHLVGSFEVVLHSDRSAYPMAAVYVCSVGRCVLARGMPER